MKVLGNFPETLNFVCAIFTAEGKLSAVLPDFP
jgi:hypothetical protein